MNVLACKLYADRYSKINKKPTITGSTNRAVRVGSALNLEPLEARQLLAASVLINEIHYDPDVKNELVEFVELYNIGDESADLSGWRLEDAISFQFPSATIIAPGEFLVVAENPNALNDKFGASSIGPYAGRLSSSGETIRLLDGTGNEQDVVDYQLGFPWPTVGNEPGYSIELVHPSLDNQLGGSWRASIGTQTVFDQAQPWSFFRGVSEPSEGTPAWREIGFDDSSWEQGVTPVGYSRRLVLGTELSDMRNGYTSVYLRKTFNVDEPSTVGGLTLQALYDDGINVWINGTHVAQENVFSAELPFNLVANSSQSNTELIDIVLPEPAQYLVAGENVIAVQLVNQSLSNSDAYFDARLLNTSNSAPGPSPGQTNSVFAEIAAPQMRQVDHSPNEPKSGEDVTITVKVTDPEGVRSVTLDYQLVDPGDYIAIDDPRYATQWINVPMLDDGANGDEQAGDNVYTTILPGELQTHRRLVRYRITSTDVAGNSVTGPYDDDPQPNFAYYVYDGVPAWTGSWRPGVEPEVTYSPDLLESIAVYQLLTTHEAHVDSQFIPDSEARSGYGGSDYPWHGTLVYDGAVYDHIGFRARGGVWRYSMGKNMWKFDFNRGHRFQARDDYGRPYDTKWDKLNFSALIQQGNFQHRGEQGLFESVGFKMYNLAGVESPNTNFVHFRIVDGADENGADQYNGDFRGMYMTIEQPDGRFLKEHGLPDGNLYKIEGDSVEERVAANLGPHQVNDQSDVREFIRITERTRPDEQWWRENLDLDRYYSYQAVSEFIHHYDTAFGKNYYYYNNPETGLWQLHPWDLDLTWADNMFGDQNHDFNVKVADYRNGESPFSPEYHNRIRELVDLLWNEEQTSLLVDEMASFIYTAGEPSFVDADRAMWDYNPLNAESSRYTNSDKNAERWHYYSKASTKDFAGMSQILKDYVNRRNERLLFGGRRQLVKTEGQEPARPTITYTGVEDFPSNALTFESSAFASPNGGMFAAMEWRLAEITDPENPNLGQRTTPVKYEIQADWESGEIADFNSEIQIPANQVEPGKLYRARVRMKDGAGLWSHWSEPVQFIAGHPAGGVFESLRITEVNYNPYDGADGEPDNDEYEFIELANVGADTIDLTGVRLADGVRFEFDGSAVTSLSPGQRVIVVRNTQAFESRYGNSITIAGQYGGTEDDYKLSNGGETISLVRGDGEIIQQFTYDDNGSWPGRADGNGSSLEIISTSGNYNDPDNWRSSAEYGGTPGQAGSGLIGDVVINEVLTHSDPPLTDAIELYNTTAEPIDVSGWFLSDARGDYKKFAIPAGTEIPAGGYLVFNEAQFNPESDSGFGLSGARGDDVWLVAADAQGNLRRFVDHIEFDAAASGVSFGRSPDGTGPLYPMDSLTLGGPNSQPRVGEVTISEIHHSPADPDGAGEEQADDFRFIELYNRTGAAIDLGGWRIRGIGHTFDAETNIDGGKTALLVTFDPADVVRTNKFRFLLNVPDEIPIVGPVDIPLEQGGNRLRIQRPDDPPPGDPEFVPLVTVDDVTYSNQSPWTTEANSTGNSLTRASLGAIGELPSSWIAATASPGVVEFETVTIAGDSNGDGSFDQKDIVLVLQGGKYLTGQSATRAEGDWNGDGLFDQRDIVVALQEGNYLRGAFAAQHVVPASAANIRITEINYNPYPPLTQFGEPESIDSDEYEFVELTNISTDSVELDGVRFAQVNVGGDNEGIVFEFAAQVLGPSEQIVIVKNREAFQARYGSQAPIAVGAGDAANGQYSGGLSNSNERLTLLDKTGEVMLQFDYKDSGAWPNRADGMGSTLELEDTAADPDKGGTWRSSSEFGGSPGWEGRGPDNRVLVNEVLAHTDPPQVDMLELFNSTNEAIDITNWYLSQSNSNYFKFHITDPTTIPANGYAVFTETQLGFSLNSFEGEEIFLVEGDANGRPVGFVDKLSFGATENSVSVGRWPNGVGRAHPMSELTLGGPNSGHKPGDIVISEINYNPVDPDGESGPLLADNYEFIELHNRSNSAVDMTNWRLNGGVDFDFPVGTLLTPGQTVLAVPFDGANAELADAFRTNYNIDSSIHLLGPYMGQLANSGEEVRLEWPDEPPDVKPDFVPFILEDRVDYNDKEPWPLSPDGQGDSLVRRSLEAFGDFPESWEGRAPSPGRVGSFVPLPGDANGDGEFNQLDLVQVLRARKYATGQPATFAEGDWNGDGVFDRLDVVAALATGRYLQGPTAAQVDQILEQF